jgi:hypothetical protein
VEVRNSNDQLVYSKYRRIVFNIKKDDENSSTDTTLKLINPEVEPERVLEATNVEVLLNGFMITGIVEEETLFGDSSTKKKYRISAYQWGACSNMAYVFSETN